MCFCNTRSGFWMWFRIIKAALGAGMGVLAAIVFSFGYGKNGDFKFRLNKMSDVWCQGHQSISKLNMLALFQNKQTFWMLAGALTASAWAVISSLLALIVLHQHLLFRKSKLASFYNTARFVMKYCFSNIKYCNHFNKLSVQFRLKYLIGGGIICLIGSLSATIYYFSMKVYLSQETYPINKRWDF